MPLKIYNTRSVNNTLTQRKKHKGEKGFRWKVEERQRNKNTYIVRKEIRATAALSRRKNMINSRSTIKFTTSSDHMQLIFHCLIWSDIVISQYPMNRFVSLVSLLWCKLTNKWLEVYWQSVSFIMNDVSTCKQKMFI